MRDPLTMCSRQEPGGIRRKAAYQPLSDPERPGQEGAIATGAGERLRAVSEEVS
jgi:hypothetical protein